MLQPIQLKSRTQEMDEHYARHPRRSMVSIRLPKELHKALLQESHKRDVSMNALCVALLNNGLLRDQ